MKIFITSWHRTHFLDRVLTNIAMYTESPHVIVYDNGSNQNEQALLVEWRNAGRIQDLFLSSKNAGTMLPKRLFHALARADGDEYYVVTDNDFLCPVDWLPKLQASMDYHDLALVTPQYWPQWPMGPYGRNGDVVYCQAVGNTFKLVRASRVNGFFADMDAKETAGVRVSPYSDDGLLCQWLADNRQRVGFCHDVFCYNLELSSPKWGYLDGQESEDPRRSGYAEPAPPYVPVNWDTLEPPEELKWRGA